MNPGPKDFKVGMACRPPGGLLEMELGAGTTGISHVPLLSLCSVQCI